MHSLRSAASMAAASAATRSNARTLALTTGKRTCRCTGACRGYSQHHQQDNPHRHRRHLIFGANTDVGKTIVSAGLLRSSRIVTPNEDAPDMVRYVKPMQCGGSDERFVRRVAELDDARATVPYEARTLFDWETPASPHTASRLEGLPVSDAQVWNAIQEHFPTTRASTITWYETAGGVLSPAASSPDNDLPWHARQSDAPTVSPRYWGWQPQADLYRPLAPYTTVLLVGDARLGGISATLSSLESLIWRGYRVAAIALIRPAQDHDVHANAVALGEIPRYPGNPTIPVLELPAIPPDPSVPLDDWYQSENVTRQFAKLEQVLAEDWLDYMVGVVHNKMEANQPTLPEPSLALSLARRVSQGGTLALATEATHQSLTEAVESMDAYDAMHVGSWAPKTPENITALVDKATENAVRTYHARMRISPEQQESMEWAICKHTVPPLSSGDGTEEDGSQDDDFSWVSNKDLVLDAPTIAYSNGKLRIRFPEGQDPTPDTVTEFESKDKVLDLAARRLAPKLFSQYKELIEMQWLVYEHAGMNRKIAAIVVQPILSDDQRWIDPLWQRALIDIAQARNVPLIFHEAGLELGEVNIRDIFDVEPDIAIVGSDLRGDSNSVIAMACTPEVQEVAACGDGNGTEGDFLPKASSIDCLRAEHQLSLKGEPDKGSGPKLEFSEDAVRSLSLLDPIVECFALYNILSLEVKNEGHAKLDLLKAGLREKTSASDLRIRRDGCRLVLTTDPFLGREARREIIACLVEVLGTQ